MFVMSLGHVGMMISYMGFWGNYVTNLDNFSQNLSEHPEKSQLFFGVLSGRVFTQKLAHIHCDV